MPEAVADISMSRDGIVAGRHDGVGRGLGAAHLTYRLTWDQS